MTRRRWIVVALGVVLLVAVALGIFWFGWDLKTLIGWRALVDYIDPKNPTDRKDAVQVYALIVAGVVAAITAAVGFANLWLTRRNLEQQRELEVKRARHQQALEDQRTQQQQALEDQRTQQQRELAQGTALQAYYEQIGNLITEYDLQNTEREDVRELARGQTLTVLQEVDGTGKGSLLTFLYGAGLIRTENPAVALTGANLQEANLQDAILHGANLQLTNLHGANLQSTNLHGANLYQTYLREANLQRAYLQEADLQDAYLLEANFREANLQEANLQEAMLQLANLQEAILQRADLQRADLRGANLRGANLREAKLQGAKLQEADLQDAYLREVEGLTQEQLDLAVGDENTVLPEYLSVPAEWWS